MDTKIVAETALRAIRKEARETVVSIPRKNTFILWPDLAETTKATEHNWLMSYRVAASLHPCPNQQEPDPILLTMKDTNKEMHGPNMQWYLLLTIKQL